MAYENKLYFYVKQIKPFKHEEIINIHIDVCKENVEYIKENGKYPYIDFMKKHFTKDKIIEDYNNILKKDPHAQEYMYLKADGVETAEPVMIYKKTKWIGGEYYAHEYDKYVSGRARQVMYTNGYSEYEIECLDKKLKVADGIWEELTSNGMGDDFEPHEILKEIEAPDITTRLKEGLK